MKKRSSHTKTGPEKFLRDLDLSGEETEIAPRVIAEFSASSLVNNYRAIAAQVSDQQILPMIKANAYGHGATWAAKLLVTEPGVYALGVATLEEGAEIRAALGPKHRRTRVIVFSGASPWSEEKGQFCEAQGLSPVINTDQDWNRFFKAEWHKKISYELEFNTGMNRVGMNPGLAPTIARSLANQPTDMHPHGVFSHLAMAESPDAALTQRQLREFASLKKELASALPQTYFHLANSAAIWNQKNFGLRDLTDVVRPGISLYGVPPWPGAPVRGLLPVATLRAQIIQIQRLKVGESIGYGATFTVGAKKGSEQAIVYAAILGIGYADGLHRTLSNEGQVWLSGQSCRFLGRISMDLSAVQCTPQTQVGEYVEIIGPNVDIWSLARSAQTIPYELLTSISPRVKRIYL